jgi:cell division protein FtsW
VIGEEMGLIVCLILIAAFAVLIIRGLKAAASSQSQFTMLAISGILLQVGLQSMFNIGMALHMFPTKGVTLPFISYGGSSMLSTAIAFGMMLAFTRKRHAVLNLGNRNVEL